MKKFAALTALLIAAGFTSIANAEGQADRGDYCDNDKPGYNVKASASAGSYNYGASNGYGDGYGNTGGFVKTSTVASAPTTVVTKVSTSVGEVFANAQGMTLYTFTKDSSGVSACYDGCADSWPPFLAKQDAKTWGEFSVVARKDGTYQWAYKNQPLYLWVGDRKQGDATGHGVGDVWFAAKP
ncbi:hypothetical protein [Hahella sp. HN01]|uniref:COG4315 family predicted lipoprotein n=1 Tax=Hahella sp. HN01 TaxID=2847262 RepID=UPI001C1EEAC1|nr:hypothetical protein [Hahella sp. HN01]MBU6953390.1 hypothetical protein [Hahella sp. HN01]